MGVPGLKTWLQKEMPRTWGTMQQAVPPTGAEHIYVDLNFVLHNCLHRCRPKTRLKLRRLLEVWLNQMLRTTRPSRSLFLAIDGPGPLAKVLHQRASRASEARKLQRKREKDGPGRPDEVSRLELTPGTLLMGEVDVWVTEWVCEKLQGGYSHLSVTLSGSTVPGEGETKIIEHLLAQRAGGREDRHFIWTSDSDMCLMAIQPGVGNVFVHLDSGKGAKKPCFSVDAFYDHVSRKVEFGSDTQRAQWEREVARDFMAICIMANGNDYLPSVMGLKQGAAWTSYLRLKTGEMRDRVLIGADGRLDKDLLVGITRLEERSAAEAAVGAEHSAPTTRAPANAEDYLHSLHWTSSMYASGVCDDYRWTYDGASPSVSMMYEAEFLDRIYTGKRSALPPSAVALSLIPKAHKELVPGCFHHLMEPESPIADLFAVCEECEDIKRGLSDASIELRTQLELLKELRADYRDALGKEYHGQITAPELTRALEKAGRELSPELEALVASIARGQQLVTQFRQQVAEINARYRSHMLSDHPYKPFPAAQLEKLVQQAIQQEQKLTKKERYLSRFGTPVEFGVPARFQAPPPQHRDFSRSTSRRRSRYARKQAKGRPAVRDVTKSLARAALRPAPAGAGGRGRARAAARVR